MDSSINRRRRGHDNDHRFRSTTRSSSSSPTSSSTSSSSPTSVAIFFLFILSLLFPLGNSLDSFYNHMIINSSKRVYLAGETININCTLISDKYANDSRDIHLSHGETRTTILPWYNNHSRLSFHYPSRWTVAFYIVNASMEDRGTYKCSGRDFPVSSVIVPHQKIAIVYPPHKPLLHDCHVIGWSNVTCSTKPTTEEQDERTYHTIQRLDASLDAQFRENATILSSAPTKANVVTVVDAIRGLHGNAEDGVARGEICLRAVVRSNFANVSSASDVTCAPVIQLVRPSNVTIRKDGDTLRLQIPQSDDKPHLANVSFLVVLQDNNTNTNISIATNDNIIAMSWRPLVAYQVWVEARYHVIGNNQSAVNHTTFVIPSTAPCKNPDTVENAFIILSHYGQSCWKIRIYFKPIKEIDWCSYKPPSYKADVKMPCFSHQMESSSSHHPLAYVDAYVTMETYDVGIIAYNDLGVSKDNKTGRVRISQKSANISLWVEGDDNDAILSWEGDGRDDIIGYTIFYCYSPMLGSVCTESMEWIQVNSSVRRLNVTSLRHNFNNHLFGISIKQSHFNTSILWTDRFYYLYAAPEPAILLSLDEVDDGKVKVKWKADDDDDDDFKKCFVTNYVVCYCWSGGGDDDDDAADCANNTNNNKCSKLLPNTATTHSFDDLKGELTYNFWVRSICRSGLSNYTVKKWKSQSGNRNFPSYMIIIIIAIVIIFVVVIAAIGRHFIKLVKKWHKKLTSGIDIRPPEPMFISKSHPDQKWSSSTSSDNRHSTYQPSHNGFNNPLLLDSTSEPFHLSSWSSNGRRDLFCSDNPSTDFSGVSVQFTRFNSANNEEYCIISGADHDDDGGGGGGDGDVRTNEATADLNLDLNVKSNVKDLMMNYCKIQSGNLSDLDETSDKIEDSFNGGDSNHPLPVWGDVEEEIREYPEVEKRHDPASDYVSSDALFDDDGRSPFYDHHDNNNNNNNVDDDNDVASDVAEVHAMNGTSSLRFFEGGDINTANEDANVDGCNGDDDHDNDYDGDDNDGGINNDEAATGTEHPATHPSPQIDEPSSNPAEYALTNNNLKYPRDDHVIPMTFYAPLPTEEEGAMNDFEGVDPFHPDMLNAPYCGLRTLLNDEMRCLLTSNEF